MGMCSVCSRNSREASVLGGYSKDVAFYAKGDGKM